MRTARIIFAFVVLALVAWYAYSKRSGDSDKLSPELENLLNDPDAAASAAASGALPASGATQIFDLTKGKLISADGSSFVFPANAPPNSIHYYAIYYSAQWCPPCHAFSPVLVEWYKKFKPSHSNFELIFVSEDHDAASMLGYMKEMAMPWPAVRFGDLKHDGGFKGSGIEQFAGSGIPDLVLVDAGGKVLSDSFTWTGSYLGPQHVLDDIEKLVPVSAVKAPPAPLPPSPSVAKPAVAASASAPSPAPLSSPAAPYHFSSPIKRWAPPDVMPAHPNWTWTTLDGTTYQNVVVTQIGPDTVSITHAMGVAHAIAIADLPPDIQKQLNYDPVAAAVARAETRREEAHPFYTMASRAEAEAEAQQMHWPLAWLSTSKDDLTTTDPSQNVETELTAMALNELKDKTIIIFIDAYAEMNQTPAIVHHQFSQFDDGALPGGANYMLPKVVFSTPDASTILGRVSYTQMKASGEVAIDEVLASILNNAKAASPASGETASATPPSSPPAIVPISVAPPAAPATATAPSAPVAAAKPSPDAVKPWTPPDVMPAKPHWTWNTLDGSTYQDVVVTEIEPNTVTISHSLGVAHIPINMLPPDIQKQLNYNPHAASQITALIDGKLVSADGTDASTPGAAVQYYAIYYSAQWCPPCHAFTPRLVKWYHAFKPAHPNFELIFVSEDHNEAAMFAYMKEMTMPWPAVRFADLQHDGTGTFRGSGIEKFADSGIPDLVLVDASGKVLSDSFQNGTYVGPETVVNDINKQVGGTAPIPLVDQAPSTRVSSANSSYVANTH